MKHVEPGPCVAHIFRTEELCVTGQSARQPKREITLSTGRPPHIKGGVCRVELVCREQFYRGFG